MARSTRRGLLALALLALLAALVLEVAIRATPPPDLAIPKSPLVLDRDDHLLRAFAVADGRWRLPVTPAAVDPVFLSLLLAFEDRRFETHRGVDARALVRALGQALRHGRIVSGGSTLTMQVVRLRGGHGTRSATGKLRQALAALALERAVDKQAVLTAYLNLAPYGGNLEGVRAGALAWLGKEPAHLTVAEAALLVALPQAPTARRPDLHPEAARRGRDRVLDRALALGVIDAATATAARLEPLPTRRRPFPLLAAHLAERLVRASPETPVHRLTLDAARQVQLESLTAAHARIVGDGVSAAVLAVDHRSGEIIATVGSAGVLDAQRAGFLDMTRALRSPGSTLKPLIYGLAFEQGLAHPESLIDDRPSGYGGGYAPENFDRTFHGTVTVREALQLSLNIPAMTVLEQVGPAPLLARLRRAGANPVLPPGAPPGLAIGLGGLGLTLRDLVGLYAALARGGQPVTLTEYRDRPPPPGLSLPVLERRAAWQLGDILSDAGRETIAIKTGTSYGYRDAWALGYDGRHVVGVWIGRPDAAAVPGLTGSERAVPLLRDAFARLGSPVPLPPAPTGLLQASSAQLPPPLARVRPRAAGLDGGAPPQIAWPPAGARIDLGLGGTGAEPAAGLVLKVRNGQPPFQWFADGVPIAREPYAREARWRPDGPGFATIAVVDGRGAAARVTVRVE